MSILYCLIAAFSLSLIFWVIFAIYRKPEIVDVFWFSSITLQMYIYFFSILKPSTFSILVLVLMSLYSWRLISYIISRIRGKSSEKRYQMISEGWKDPLWGFLANYLFQASLSFGIAIVFYPLFSGPQNTDLQIIGFLISTISVFGEWLCDEDLRAWKKNNNPGICKTRLWNYSRHPNIFFEILIWVGLALMSSSSLLAFIAWVSPITIYIVTVIITVPITERSSLSHRKDEYQDYINTTSMIIPWKKKKS